MRPRRPLAQTCVVLLFVISIGPLWTRGQNQSQPNANTAKPNTQPKTTPSQQPSKPGIPPGPSLQSKLAADVTASRDLGDYIPCEFSRVDLLNLRPRPAIYTLTDADEDALRSRIIAEALDDQNAGAFPETAVRDNFVKDISEAAFVGLTPSQATGKVLYVLGQDTTPSKEVGNLLSAADKDNQTFANFLQSTYLIPVETAIQQLGPTAQTTQSKLTAAIALADKNKVGQAQDVAQAAQNLSTTASQATKALSEGAAAKNQVAAAAQKATAAIARPLDVACSMSILSYETTRYAFGQRMADEFIPVQIVVRNLNPDKEFLVQDAELAVDEDINGRLGRYAAGIDKITARTFMLSSRDYSHRNLVVHLAQGAGTILSTTSLVYGTAVKDAANVYSAGFLNALTGVWTDHGTDQLNLLNDEGFSSYRTERTVVPKSGTAEFVIFFRSDQFQEGWWTQACAENIAIQNPDKLSQVEARQSATCIGELNRETPNPKCLANTEISVDLDAARKVCVHFYKNPKNHSVNGLVDIGSEKDVIGDLAYFKPASVPYKKWSSRSTALFRELSIAVIAGTHIQEETNNALNMTKVDCPTDDKGDVDFDKAANGTISCTLAGNNLDEVQTLKLRNAVDATDTKTATAPVTTTTSGASKTSKVAFPLDTLGALPAKAYKIYTVSKDGVEGGGDLQLHLSGDPYLPAEGTPDPNTINFTNLLGNNGKPISITLKGYHLDTLQSVRFAKSQTDKTKVTVTPFDVSVDSGATATQAQVTVKPDDAKKANVTGDLGTEKLELSIALFSKSAPNTPVAAKQVVYGTENLTAGPAQKSVTTPKPTKGKQ